MNYITEMEKINQNVRNYFKYYANEFLHCVQYHYTFLYPLLRLCMLFKLYDSYITKKDIIFY